MVVHSTLRIPALRGGPGHEARAEAELTLGPGRPQAPPRPRCFPWESPSRVPRAFPQHLPDPAWAATAWRCPRSPRRGTEPQATFQPRGEPHAPSPGGRREQTQDPGRLPVPSLLRPPVQSPVPGDLMPFHPSRCFRRDLTPRTPPPPRGRGGAEREEGQKQRWAPFTRAGPPNPPALKSGPGAFLGGLTGPALLTCELGGCAWWGRARGLLDSETSGD